MVFSWLHAAIALFLAAGLAFACGPLAASFLLAPRLKSPALLAPYECGLPAHGQARVRFGLNFFFYALIFLSFDVDVLYLFPVAARFNQDLSWTAVALICGFVCALVLAVVYCNRLGVFTWPRRIDV